MRAGPGFFGATAPQPGVVAFQTSFTSLDGTARWEVLVQGRAQPVTGTSKPTPPSLELVTDEATTLLSVDMDLVSGWQYAAPEKSEPDSGHGHQGVRTGYPKRGRRADAS